MKLSLCSLISYLQGEPSEKYWADGDALMTFNDVQVRTLNEVECPGYLERNIEIFKEKESVRHRMLLGFCSLVEYNVSHFCTFLSLVTHGYMPLMIPTDLI